MNATVTVRQLRRFLANFSDDEPVVVGSYWDSSQQFSIVEMYGQDEACIAVEEVEKVA